MTDEVLYPWGYLKTLVTMARLKQLARFDLMEPEYARRLEAWLVSKGGKIGIGGAFRTTQPTLPGFAPDGLSFHQLQTFADATKWFMAVDLVVRNGDEIHRAPYWSEVPKQGSGHSDITNYGLHANVNGEPWHLQAIEADGHGGWVTNGRKRPNPAFKIKGQPDPAPTPTPVPVPKPPPGEPVHAPGSRTLRVTDPQMHGIDIVYLQQTLTKQGLVGIDDDGYYGPATAEGVKKLQGWNGQQKTGVVGPATWDVVMAYNDGPKPAPSPTPAPTPAPAPAPGVSSFPVGSRTLRLVSPTMKGTDVIWVQNVLRKQGLNVSVDGVYGRQTRDKVMIMQGWNNLDKDGVVGPQTFKVLKQY